MATKKQNQQHKKPVKKRLSKRDRTMRLFVYIMIIAMLLSSLTAGLVYFI